jgi:hypothetical protein
METSASFEARYAPLLYPTNQVGFGMSGMKPLAGQGEYALFPTGRMSEIILRTHSREGTHSKPRGVPVFSPPPLKFRTAGFPQYGFKAGRSDRAFPFDASSPRTVCHCPSCSPLPSPVPRSVPGDVVRWSTSVRAAAAALPQGPSLRTGFFCPAPSSLNRPHPPHSQAHPLFTAQRLIGDTFAVHTTPRRPPSGSTLSLSFLLDMPPSTTPRRSQPVGSSHAVPTWAFAML